MIVAKRIEVWKGKKQIGTVTTTTNIVGKSMVFPTISLLKEKYGRRYESIELPIGYRVLIDDGVDWCCRRILIANHKSKRQLKYVLDSLSECKKEK